MHVMKVLLLQYLAAQHRMQGNALSPRIEDLAAFLSFAVIRAHILQRILRMLEKKGSTRLGESDSWQNILAHMHKKFEGLLTCLGRWPLTVCLPPGIYLAGGELLANFSQRS